LEIISQGKDDLEKARLFFGYESQSDHVFWGDRVIPLFVG